MTTQSKESKEKVEISLLGQRFSLRSDKNEEYVQALAKFVTQQLDDVRKQSRATSTHHVALLTTLNLADLLFQREEEIRRLKSEIRTKTEDAIKELDLVVSLLPQQQPHDDESKLIA